MSEHDTTDRSRRLHGLLAGAVEPPNEFVAYHVKMAREAKAEHDSLVQVITKVAQQLAVLRQRALMLHAQAEAHRQSIAAWDAVPEEPQDSTPSSL